MISRPNSRIEYDVIVVLCGGSRKTPDGYEPTTFEDSDVFGMLGGFIRVFAALAMHEQYPGLPVLFSTGVSAKEIEQFGADVPPGSHVYRDAFLKSLHTEKTTAATDLPQLFVEDTSVNTVGNITETLKICEHQQWRRLAVISSEYHLPRISALYKLITEHIPNSPQATFLSAEAIVRAAWPGRYDRQINAAYMSTEGKKRIQNERQGLMDIQEGRYVLTEYQLAEQ